MPVVVPLNNLIKYYKWILEKILGIIGFESVFNLNILIIMAIIFSTKIKELRDDLGY